MIFILDAIVNTYVWYISLLSWALTSFLFKTFLCNIGLLVNHGVDCVSNFLKLCFATCKKGADHTYTYRSRWVWNLLLLRNTYIIIGHYNPSVRIIDLVSHTTYVVYANFIHTYIQNDRFFFFWEIFHGNFIYSHGVFFSTKKCALYFKKFNIVFVS